MVQLSRIGKIQTSHDLQGASELRVEWLQTVGELADQVCGWVAHQKKWAVLPRPDKEITEEPLGTYPVPVMQIQTKKGTAVLEPVARNVRGSDGCVDLYAYPTLFRVRLLYREADHTWTIRTDSGLNWPHPWNEETFVELVNGLIGA